MNANQKEICQKIFDLARVGAEKEVISLTLGVSIKQLETEYDEIMKCGMSENIIRLLEKLDRNPLGRAWLRMTGHAVLIPKLQLMKEQTAEFTRRALEGS